MTGMPEKKFDELIAELDEQCQQLANSLTSIMLLKKYTANLIDLSKYVTDFNRQYKEQKGFNERHLSERVHELLSEGVVKHKNKAEEQARTEMSEYLKREEYLENLKDKSKMLYNSYDKMQSVSHTERKHVMRDMAHINMYQQMENYELPEGFTYYEKEDE